MMVNKKIHFGESNPVWKGDNARRVSIRGYMRKHIEKPAVCPKCGLNKKLYLYNITGIYNRDPKSWQWKCRYNCGLIIDRGPPVPCVCGCGKLKLQKDNRSRITKYLRGHSSRPKNLL
jgi:hypothetical protein